ncbi:MAG TPA: hypothetical protein DCS67_08245 [Clostridiales bacterium UBA8960]|nr:hypothetical protein [Clostridiales bacterium UBA8960]
MSDMMHNATFQEDHIETEKTVIIDEINMYEDAAEEIVIDILNEIIFKGHSLSYPILGTKKSVNGFTREILMDYYLAYYNADNMIISIAGDFDESLLLEKVNAYFGCIRRGTGQIEKMENNPVYQWNFDSKKKDFEQIQVAISFPGIRFDHELSYEMMVLSNILGGTNSSRLFQSIREDRGLTYSIYTEPNFYDEIGTFTISFGVSKDNLIETLKLIAKELKILMEHLITPEALEHAKNHLRGSFFLNLEGSDNYMDMIGRIELFAHREKNIDDMLDKINGIQLSGVTLLIDQCFANEKIAMAIVGDIEKQETESLYKMFCNALTN